MALVFFEYGNFPVGDECPRLPDEIGLSMTICSPVMRNARCLGMETLMCASSAVSFCNNGALMLTAAARDHIGALRIG